MDKDQLIDWIEAMIIEGKHRLVNQILWYEEDAKKHLQAITWLESQRGKK